MTKADWSVGQRVLLWNPKSRDRPESIRDCVVSRVGREYLVIRAGYTMWRYRITTGERHKDEWSLYPFCFPNQAAIDAHKDEQARLKYPYELASAVHGALSRTLEFKLVEKIPVARLEDLKASLIECGLWKGDS